MHYRLRDPITGRFIKKASSKGRRITKRRLVKKSAKRMRATESGKNVSLENVRNGTSDNIEDVYDRIIKTKLPGLSNRERMSLVDRMVMFGRNIKNIDDIYEFVDIFNWDQFIWAGEKENDNIIIAIQKYYNISNEDAQFIYYVLDMICRQIPFDGISTYDVVKISTDSLMKYYDEEEYGEKALRYRSYLGLEN